MPILAFFAMVELLFVEPVRPGSGWRLGQQDPGYCKGKTEAKGKISVLAERVVGWGDDVMVHRREAPT